MKHFLGLKVYSTTLVTGIHMQFRVYIYNHIENLSLLLIHSLTHSLSPCHAGSQLVGPAEGYLPERSTRSSQTTGACSPHLLAQHIPGTAHVLHMYMYMS